MIDVKNEGLVRKLNRLNRWEDLLTPIEWRGYYHLLDENEKDIYDLILKAIIECQSYVYVKEGTSLSGEDIGRIFHFVLYDNPAVIDIDEYAIWDALSEDKRAIKIPLTADNSMLENCRRTDILEAVRELLSSNSGIYLETNLDKELFIHDYICASVSFDESLGDDGKRTEPYNIWGPLIEKKAVCLGIAKLTKLLLEILGIQSFVVSGTINNPKKPQHAWNLVMLDNKAYHLDVTLDMCETKDTDGLLRRDFFNVSDTVMDREVIWEGKDAIWKCTSYDLNYVYLVGGYISSAEACRKYIAKKLKEKRKLIYVRLNKKTLGDIKEQQEWVKERYCEAATTVPLHFKGIFEKSELNGLIVMHMEYIEN